MMTTIVLIPSAYAGDASSKSWVSSAAKELYESPAESGFATKTKSYPLGSRGLLNLKNSRRRRFTRFLLTALPTFLLTDIPSLRVLVLLRYIMTVKCGVEYRVPLLKTI